MYTQIHVCKHLTHGGTRICNYSTSFSGWEGLVVLEALGQVEEREREGMMVAAE